MWQISTAWCRLTPWEGIPKRREGIFIRHHGKVRLWKMWVGKSVVQVTEMQNQMS